MTYRQRFERRAKTAMWAAFGCFALLFAIFVAQQIFAIPRGVTKFLAIPLMIGFAVIGVIDSFVRAFRCPNCRINLRHYFGAEGIHYCPHCALDLDQEIGTAGEAIHRP